jgi:hypothetical protein
MSVGFVKLMRTPEADELMENDPKAFLLLTQVARRAWRTHGQNVRGLKPREALVGDHRKCGLTYAEYRHAKKRLARYGYATFNGTTKGTVATIVNDLIYDINEEPEAQTERQQGANEAPSKRQRSATNKNGKNEKNERRERAPSSSSNRSFMTFEEMDHQRAREGNARAREEFLANAAQGE